jgi:hypothetical protein
MTVSGAPGTGVATVGAAITDAINGNLRTLAAAGAVDGRTYRFLFIDGNAWELSDCVVGAGQTTLTRTLVSSSTGALINLSASTKLYQGPTAADLDRVNINVGRVPLTDGATINTDASLGNVFSVTLGGNRTLANPTNLEDGSTYIWVATQDATGSRTLSYGNLFVWLAGTAPTLKTAAGAKNTITAVYDGTSLLAVAN